MADTHPLADGTIPSSGQTSDDGANPPGLVIPDEAKKKHPDLVALVLKSESMNTEEKNYWLQVLPVMTPDQVAELRDILETEKKKLAAIDAKYASQKGGVPGQQEAKLSEEDLKKMEEERRKKQEKRRAEEAKHKEADEDTAEDLLSQLDDL